MSESAAYARITAARAARDFPIVLTLLSNGGVTLTTVSLLASHLTDENHEALLEAARHKSKREVEHLVACLDPQPDVVSSLRKLPERRQAASDIPQSMPILAPATSSPAAQPLAAAPSAPRRAVVAPLAADRYLLKVTLSREGHTKLERARDLLRHQIPNGDPAAIVERALAVLVDQLEKTKHASTERPRVNAQASSASRRVPAAVKRAVWTRDDGRCAFVGADGRCGETGCLEFHHVVAFAAGGLTSVENLQLRCRAHNVYEATLSGQSWASNGKSRAVEARRAGTGSVSASAGLSRATADSTVGSPLRRRQLFSRAFEEYARRQLETNMRIETSRFRLENPDLAAVVAEIIESICRDRW